MKSDKIGIFVECGVGAGGRGWLGVGQGAETE